jgi:His-Xaa-Ser system radical SAM maturase HxsC
MLNLRGKAIEAFGFDTDMRFVALRLKRPNSQEIVDGDVALIRTSTDFECAKSKGFKKYLFFEHKCAPAESSNDASYVVVPTGYEYLDDGDIIGFQPTSRRFRSLYRRSSSHNSFFVTERCNHYCLMCSQPPRDVDDEWLLDEISMALPLVNKDAEAFSFTGGEPLLSWQKFVSVLTQCRDLLPNTAVHVLTNGRAFADSKIAKAYADVKHPCISVGIPIYSAIDYIHDYVVQSKGALDETVLGILNLKNFGQRVEVRVVLHAITAPRIFETCHWLTRNLPFVDHVALMGLENTGFALANEEALAIDPLDYMPELERALECLSVAGINASIYNLPRCILPRRAWPYAVQSISDWKRGYIAECDECTEKNNCSGFFTTGKLKPSRGISAIRAP